MRLPGNLNLEFGQLINTKQENLAALPAFIPGQSEGRIVYVTGGPDVGYWFGSDDGSNTFRRLNLSTTLVEYSLVGQSINNGATHQATLTPPSTVAAQKGLVVKVVVSSNLASGNITVRIHNNAGRTDLVYDSVFNLASLAPDKIPAFFELDNVSGNVYLEVVNNTGQNGTFSVTITTAGLVLVQTPQAPGSGSGINAGVAGDGIEYNAVDVRLDLDLSSTPGLELVGSSGSRELQVFTAPSGGLERHATGLRTDTSVLRTTGDQTGVTGVKQFGQLAMTPSGITGPPASGAHVDGEFSMDQNNDVWLCITAGTPGTWVLYSWKESVAGGLAAGSYTGSVAPGASVNLDLTFTGRRGWMRKMNIWAALSTFVQADLDIPFRVKCYPNENREERELLWAVSGQIRSTFITGAVGAGANIIPLNSVGGVNLDDLVRLRKAVGPLEEYQRVSVRSTAPVQVTVFETTVNSFVANDLFMAVTEFVNLPYRNNSGVPANQNKLFLKFHHDGPSSTIVFGYHVFVEEMGGGVPI